jgi:hypothetical protein
MKYIPLFCFALMNISLSADQLPKGRDERLKEMAKEGYNIIDRLFEHAHASIEKKENLMCEQWLSEEKEIKDLRNLLSDSYIEAFDETAKNPIPELLSDYVESKINEEASKIFYIDNISKEEIKDFYRFSYTICKLSGGQHCSIKIRLIKKNNSEKKVRWELEKVVKKQITKEEALRLQDVLIFGAHR